MIVTKTMALTANTTGTQGRFKDEHGSFYFSPVVAWATVLDEEGAHHFVGLDASSSGLIPMEEAENFAGYLHAEANLPSETIISICPPAYPMLGNFLDKGGYKSIRPVLAMALIQRFGEKGDPDTKYQVVEPMFESSESNEITPLHSLEKYEGYEFQGFEVMEIS